MSLGVKDYILNAERFWPPTHKRNVVKIMRALDAYAGESSSDKDECIDELLAVAKIRGRFNAKHLYLINTGSSGSHWIEAMLGLLPGFYNGGEIYLPPKVRSSLKNLNKKSANEFLDVIYLLHSGGIHKDALTATLSNSAHLAKHQQMSEYSINKSTVLLLRNTVDVVISRTFRKDEYKNDVAPSLDDQQYLERNCVYVESFFSNLDETSFDAIVKYEDFVASPLSNLKKLVELIEMEVTEDQLQHSIDRTSMKSELKAVEKGGNALTNVYLGDRKNYDWARGYLSKRLEKLLIKYNYCK
tara:strand:+ start:2403 stop:3302 length:900 start_codon:yes stop_codon:yes gene_type:complete